MSHYIQVNIGQGELTLAEFTNFIADVADILEHSVVGWKKPTVEVHRGVGSWKGEPENSAHISATTEQGWYIAAVRNDLAELKKDYGQEAIALVTHSTLL